jgi:general secretion pathway protein A
MDYFTILNMEREPFSNSPDPDLFCPSRSHVECLQLLEMAIRLSRGLNVVIGEVGTGKTTLSRKLIQQFSAAHDRDRVEVHLVLDPSFSTPEEFLASLAGFFGLTFREALPTERQFKEAIKASLFTKGIDEGKIAVLLIDEGQKLPGFCIEILRELLNYETNDRKLLQIVIFAQTEFEQAVRRYANFADRINLSYRLHPLNIVETGRMIKYRIAHASGQGQAPLRFSLPAIYAVYRATGGYPRAINMLCHHVVLAVIIQNRVRVSWSLVRSCAGRLTARGPARRTMNTAIAAVLLAVSLTLLVSTLNKSVSTGSLNKSVSTGSPRGSDFQKTAASPPASVVPHKKTRAAASGAAVIPAKPAVPRPVSARAARPDGSLRSRGAPSILGQLPLDTGKSAWRNFMDLYASSDANLFRVFKQANPHIEESGAAGAGAMANIPAIPTLSGSAVMRNSCAIQIDRLESFAEAYRRFKTFRNGDSTVAVMLVPYWSSRDGLVFVLLLKDRFPDRVSAVEAMERLPISLQKKARIIDGWDEDTVFYRGFGEVL